MKYHSILLTIIILASTFFFTGCKEEDFPVPENSPRHDIAGGAFGITLSLEGKFERDITAVKEDLSSEIEQYIRENLDTENNKYFAQVEENTVQLIDLKRKSTKVFTIPLEDGFTHVDGALPSPTGKYLAVNITQGAHNPWSRLLMINVEREKYSQPLDDNTLLEPSAESFCEEMTLVERRTAEDQFNECVAEKPMTVYILDFWRNSHTLELIKQFPSSTILYSVDTK